MKNDPPNGRDSLTAAPNAGGSGFEISLEVVCKKFVCAGAGCCCCPNVGAMGFNVDVVPLPKIAELV